VGRIAPGHLLSGRSFGEGQPSRLLSDNHANSFTGRMPIGPRSNRRAGSRRLEFMKQERSYLSTIENYAGERITFLGESISGSYA
jgi:hypothetical protein